MEKRLQEPISRPTNRRVKISLEAIAWKHMIALMCVRETNRAQIREATGLSQTTVNRWLAVLHQAPNNLIYISKYTRSATVGPYTEWYSFGFCQQDVPRPRPLTKAERNRKARRKYRTDRSSEEKGIIRHASK
jgi:hypothetical protein